MASISLDRPRVLARRALLKVFGLLIAFLAIAGAWAAVREQERNCNSAYWKILVYKFEPELYAKKCGCPNNLDFTFSCNSQYIGIF